MEESDNKPNKIVSLQSRRQERNRASRKQYLSAEDRCKELEEDMVRVIDMCLELDATVNYQTRAIEMLIRQVQKLTTGK